MKNRHIACFAAGLLSLSIGNAFASNAVINFTGQIIDQTCEVDTASQDQTVDLGVYTVSQFQKKVGTETPPIPFAIEIKDCVVGEAGLHYRIYLTGNSDVVEKDYLQIPVVAGNATGVAIKIKDKNGVLVPMNRYVELKDSYLAYTSDFTVNLVANYISTQETVKPGLANASTEVTFNYR